MRSHEVKLDIWKVPNPSTFEIYNFEPQYDHIGIQGAFGKQMALDKTGRTRVGQEGGRIVQQGYNSHMPSLVIYQSGQISQILFHLFWWDKRRVFTICTSICVESGQIMH